MTLSQVTPWIAICIKSNEASNHTIIEELINQLQHVYNNSELRERATHILKALKQKEKSFTRHLITFKQTLLKAEGLKWDDTVKKTFFSNSLNVMLMWALIATSISVLYNEYIILLQQVSYNLKLIQKTATQKCCMITIIITQQSHSDFMNWEVIKHISVTATKTKEKHRAQWVSKKKVTECCTKQLCMQCEKSEHFVKDCKLLLIVQPQIINAAAAETVKKVTETNKNSKKE